jgi:hypothetical protein
MAQRHLVSVWNPSYEADAMDQHLSVLLANATRFRKEECSEEDVYVWWGKSRSANRQQPMPHLGDVLAIDAELGRMARRSPPIGKFISISRTTGRCTSRTSPRSRRTICATTRGTSPRSTPRVTSA